MLNLTNYLLKSLLAEISPVVHEGPAISLTMVFVAGFIAAATLGSIAWYNSKRPPGWEDKERPAVVPDIDK